MKNKAIKKELTNIANTMEDLRIALIHIEDELYLQDECDKSEEL